MYAASNDCDRFLTLDPDFIDRRPLLIALRLFGLFGLDWQQNWVALMARLADKPLERSGMNESLVSERASALAAASQCGSSETARSTPRSTASVPTGEDSEMGSTDQRYASGGDAWHSSFS